MFNADDDVQPRPLSLSVPQLQRLIALAEEITPDGQGDERSPNVHVYEVAGLRALERAVIAKISFVGSGGSNTYTEALIDRAGEVRVGYESDH